MSADPITSAEAFANALSEVVNRYMTHLEPSADVQTYGVKMDVTGERLNIAFSKAPGLSPYVSFTLQQQSEEAEQSGGLFGRKA